VSISAIVFLLILTYAYIGYPLVIWVLARLFPSAHVTNPNYAPTVSICIASHNGADYLAEKLDSILMLTYDPSKLEILVCSDGSTDATDEIMAAYCEREPRIRFIKLPRGGKPTAINRLSKEATGEILVMTDVRQLLQENAVGALVRSLSDPEVACVSGYLEIRGNTDVGLYWRYERWIRHNESTFRSLTGVTGALYAIRRKDWPLVPADIVLDDVWVPILLRLQRRRILLATDAIAYDDPADVRREFARKTRTLFGNYQLFFRLPQTLLPWTNPSFFEVMSHKVLRLLGPWLLLGLAIASLLAFLESVGNLRLAFGVLVAGQLAFYLAALLGSSAGRTGNFARTFVVLNASAVVGLWHFLGRKNWVMW
jgi:biofilm PGA synthesis N-glycosyltransferase PgaC